MKFFAESAPKWIHLNQDEVVRITMFQLAYFQMVGAGKARNQDALFDGTAVRQVRLHKTRVSEADDAVRLAVADGVSSSPAAHLAQQLLRHACRGIFRLVLDFRFGSRRVGRFVPHLQCRRQPCLPYIGRGALAAGKP